MGRHNTQDWPYLRGLFQELRGTTSLPRFCRENNLVHGTCKKAFERLARNQAGQEQGKKNKKRGAENCGNKNKINEELNTLPATTDAGISERILTPKQQIFVREYLKDMNATQAYLRAGYKTSEDVAGVMGGKLLKKPRIAAAINHVLGSRLSSLDINNDTILREIALMAFGNIFDFIRVQADGTAYVDLSKLTREQAAAIQELSFEEGMDSSGGGVKPIKKVKFKLADKKGSLELLGKYLKLFSDTTPVMSRSMDTILKSLLSGTITTREAAYRINLLGLPLPEALKIELSKAEPVAPPVDVPPSLDDAELEERYKKALLLHEQQVTVWVPERREEVAEIKDELKGADSFAPGIGVE